MHHNVRRPISSLPTYHRLTFANLLAGFQIPTPRSLVPSRRQKLITDYRSQKSRSVARITSQNPQNALFLAQQAPNHPSLAFLNSQRFPASFWGVTAGRQYPLPLKS